MSTIKSLSVGNGNLFYIRHNTANFTIIDCNITDDREDEIMRELDAVSHVDDIKRFVSTHPDEDHIRGLPRLDDEGLAWNFYCVENDVHKDDETDAFKRYKRLRDGDRHFYLYRGCSRHWMNESNEERGSSGIDILWPDTENKHYKDELEAAANYGNDNNICPIIQYSLESGVRAIWMGDLERNFMEDIEYAITLPECDILFAPHHGRKSGHVIKTWLDELDPKIIIVGEAPSKDLEYYSDYNTITQNSAGDIAFVCKEHCTDVYVSSASYEVDFLSWKTHDDLKGMWYLGSFETRR